MAGRWASLTLSALYDGALDFKDITRDDPQSIFREQLIIEEASRRRSMAFLQVKATAVAHLRIKPELHFDLLKEVLDQALARQYPWIEGNKVADDAAEMEEYEATYARVVAAYRIHEAEVAEKERIANG